MHANIQLQDAAVEMDSSLVGVLILLFKLKMKLQNSQTDPLFDQWYHGGKKITRKTKT